MEISYWNRLYFSLHAIYTILQMRDDHFPYEFWCSSAVLMLRWILFIILWGWYYLANLFPQDEKLLVNFRYFIFQKNVVKKINFLIFHPVEDVLLIANFYPLVSEINELILLLYSQQNSFLWTPNVDSRLKVT